MNLRIGDAGRVLLLGTLIAMVDPLVIAAIAIVVAVVLIAFYLPLFSMAAQVR